MKFVLALAVALISFQASAASADEDDPTALGHLPGDIGESFASLFSWSSALPSFAITGATAAAAPFDDDVRAYFGRADRLGKAADIASNAAVLSGTIGAVIVAGRLSSDARNRTMSYELIQGLLVNNGVAFSIKAAVRRERPDGGNFAFPSGHASNVFTFATIVGDRYGWKAAIPLHLFATYISVARLDNDSHWLSDTVAGAGLGLLVGYSVIRKRPLPTPSERITWTPVFPPRGIGVQFRVALGPSG